MSDTIICVNGNTYHFDCSKEELMQKFNNHIAGVGYFMETARNGSTVIINPSHCSVISIFELK